MYSMGSGNENKGLVSYVVVDVALVPYGTVPPVMYFHRPRLPSAEREGQKTEESSGTGLSICVEIYMESDQTNTS
jgi:hypothetical protein